MLMERRLQLVCPAIAPCWRRELLCIHSNALFPPKVQVVFRRFSIVCSQTSVCSAGQNLYVFADKILHIFAGQILYDFAC